MSNSPINNRKRAWFLIKVEPRAYANTVAETIFNKFGDKEFTEENADNFCVIRADVVSGCTLFDIIVPVDANPEIPFDDVKNEILNETGREGITISVSEVTHHYPNPPHATFGYVNEEEWVKGKEYGVSPADPDEPGLQSPYSPGANKWG